MCTNAHSAHISCVDGSFLMPRAFAVALALFVKRKSETAGMAAPSRLLQAMLRIGVCALPCTVLLCTLFSNKEIPSLSVVIVYLLVVALFFMYELLSTKNVKNLVRIIPQLLLLGCVNVAVYGGLQLLDHHYTSFAPSAQQIQSVQIYRPNIQNAAADAVRIKDEALFQLISTNLKETIAEEERPSYKIYFDVIIHTEDGSAQRRIYMSYNNYHSLMDLLANNRDYCAAFTELPAADLVSSAIVQHFAAEEQTTVFPIQLYESLRNEVKGIDPVKWYQALSKAQKMGVARTTLYKTIISTTFVGDKYDRTVSLPIYQELTPNTYQLYLRYRWEAEQEARAQLYYALLSPVKNSSIVIYKPGFLSNPLEIFFSEDYQEGVSEEWRDILVKAHQVDSLDPNTVYYPYIIDLYPDTERRIMPVLFLLPVSDLP